MAIVVFRDLAVKRAQQAILHAVLVPWDKIIGPRRHTLSHWKGRAIQAG